MLGGCGGFRSSRCSQASPRLRIHCRRRARAGRAGSETGKASCAGATARSTASLRRRSRSMPPMVRSRSISRPRAVRSAVFRSSQRPTAGTVARPTSQFTSHAARELSSSRSSSNRAARCMARCDAHRSGSAPATTSRRERESKIAAPGWSSRRSRTSRGSRISAPSGARPRRRRAAGSPRNARRAHRRSRPSSRWPAACPTPIRRHRRGFPSARPCGSPLRRSHAVRRCRSRSRPRSRTTPTRSPTRPQASTPTARATSSRSSAARCASSSSRPRLVAACRRRPRICGRRSSKLA